MNTSRGNWNAGDRPSLRVTASGIALLAYLDYVNIRKFVSPTLLSRDTRVPTTPPEQYDLDRPQPLESENPEDGEITDYESGGTYSDEWYDDDNRCDDCYAEYDEMGFCPYCDYGEGDDEFNEGDW